MSANELRSDDTMAVMIGAAEPTSAVAAVRAFSSVVRAEGAMPSTAPAALSGASRPSSVMMASRPAVDSVPEPVAATTVSWRSRASPMVARSEPTTRWDATVPAEALSRTRVATSITWSSSAEKLSGSRPISPPSLSKADASSSTAVARPATWSKKLPMPSRPQNTGWMLPPAENTCMLCSGASNVSRSASASR